MFSSLNYLLLVIRSSTLVHLIMLPIIKVFSLFSTSGFLHSITSANGSQTLSQGIDTAQILPSLFVTSLLYVSNFLFNFLPNSCLTRSLICLITFTNSKVTFHDWTSGQTIGVRCESQDLYYFSMSYTTYSPKDSPFTIHAQFGHPYLPKIQKLVPNSSKLSTLHCESC